MRLQISVRIVYSRNLQIFKKLSKICRFLDIPQDPVDGVSNTPSAWGFSLDELREAHGKDQSLELILEWLKSSVKPEEGALFMASPATKSYWLNKEQFVLIDGVLFRNRNDGDEKDW